MTQPPTKRRAGRTAVDGAINVKRASITLEEADHAKVHRNGGSPWVRGLIRAAPERAELDGAPEPVAQDGPEATL